ncbi:MAG: DNA polymerase III subunit gamma/tau [Clostridia bacterium]|nr:DNA polymerase III subunit gamma/tau [Clostridia bacterium]
MHQALYRKWRPLDFDSVCGQEHITDILKYETERGLFCHAYLFCGSRGTGKTTCAKILSRAVNCEHPIGGNPCGECASCRAILDGTTTDVLEMDAASNNKVDDIRTILDEVVYTPSNVRRRVYIIDEVHMLTTSAFNALLKTLEEPPEHVVFILATTEMQKLPATVISRCQRFDFRRIATPVLVSRLKYIAGEENITLTDDAALMLARLATGGMRDAISLFELCAAAGCEVNAATVSETIGVRGREAMSETVRAITQKNCARLFEIVAEIDASASDLGVFWQELIEYYRDMLVMKTARGSASKYLDLTDSESERLAADAAAFTREMLSYHCRLLDDAYSSMQRPGASRRTVAELTLVRLSDEKLGTTPEALLARISALEAKIAMGIPAAPAPQPVPQPAPQTEAPVFDDFGEPPPFAEYDIPPADDDFVPYVPEDAAPVRKTSTPAPKSAPAPTPAPVRRAEPRPAIAAPLAKKERVLRPIRQWAEILESFESTAPMISALLKTENAYFDENNKIVICYSQSLTKTMLSLPDKFRAFCSAASVVLDKPITEKDVIFELVKKGEAPTDAKILADELEALAEENN